MVGNRGYLGESPKSTFVCATRKELKGWKIAVPKNIYIIAILIYYQDLISHEIESSVTFRIIIIGNISLQSQYVIDC